MYTTSIIAIPAAAIYSKAFTFKIHENIEASFRSSICCPFSLMKKERKNQGYDQTG